MWTDCIGSLRTTFYCLSVKQAKSDVTGSTVQYVFLLHYAL